MKKFLLVSLVILFAVSAMAEINFYGEVRSGLWYEIQNEDYTGTNDTKVELDSQLYSSSRLGIDFNLATMKSKVEMGLGSNDVYLRLLYAEFPVGDFQVLIGQNYTGFDDLSKQASHCNSGSDDSLIGYGVAHDGRKNQIRLTHKSGFYGMLLEPVKIDPIGTSGEMEIDAITPKINLGYKTKINNVEIAPSLGFVVSQYNEDFSGFNEEMFAFVAAFGITYRTDEFCFKGNLNFGQNVKDYGILGDQIKGSYAKLNSAETKYEILDASNAGGYGQFGYNLDENKTLIGGVGFVTTNRDDFKQEDSAMSAFAQLNYKLNNNVSIIPEVGIIDNMENCDGDVEGAVYYLGSKFQINFAHSVQ